MRIAWFTPFNIESAIGRYSKFAAEALSEFADVDIYVFQKDNLHKTKLNVIYFENEDVVKKLDNYDIVIYNIGDNYEYHAPIYDIAQIYRGIIINHDVCLHNFFRGYYYGHRNDVQTYQDNLKRLYGEEMAMEIVKAGDVANKWDKLDFFKYNMSELVVLKCMAIVVHSKYHFNQISKIYNGPIENISLPDMTEFNTGSETGNVSEKPNNKINILTVGNVNYNKRIYSVIQAIGNNHVLKEKVNYYIVGSLVAGEYVATLQKIINDLNLNKNVHLLGVVSHDELAGHYRDADIITNLRSPALEGGSASLVEQMMQGKGIIVSKTGLYADLPDDCVFKIGTDNEVEELTKTLLQILDKPSLIKTRGENAKKFAQTEYSRENYGRKLYSFIKRIIFIQPIDKLVQDVGYELNNMNITKSIPISENIANEIEKMTYKIDAAKIG